MLIQSFLSRSAALRRASCSGGKAVASSLVSRPHHSKCVMSVDDDISSATEGIQRVMTVRVAEPCVDGIPDKSVLALPHRYYKSIV